MLSKKGTRNFNQPIHWKGDLNDDCTARWAGFMLRAEWMDEDYWWWCVYDLFDNQNQIDSSNNYDERFLSGEIARNKAEEIARNHIKNELTQNTETQKKDSKSTKENNKYNFWDKLKSIFNF